MAEKDKHVTEAGHGIDALTRLFALWIAISASVIEFYARRYEFAEASFLPHGVLAVIVVAALLVPERVIARLFARREMGSQGRLLVVLAIAWFFSVTYRFQFVHVGVVCVLLTAILSALWVILLVPAFRAARRAVVALTLAAASFLLIAYYILLIVGRETWNQIVSRELIYTYVPHLPELILAMPISSWIPCAVAGILFVALFVIYWIEARNIAAELLHLGARVRGAMVPRDVSHRPRALTLWIVAVAMAFGSEWLFQAAAHGHTPDPLLTTFFVDQGQPGKKGTMFVADDARDARDREIAGTYPVPDRIDRRTIVLITIDALRADQMNLYGHAVPNTPFLSRLHREGNLVRYENAFSACTESLCGLLSIQASRFWHHLGTRNFGLTDVLKRLGFRTHYFLGGDHSNFYGLRAFYGTSIDQFLDGHLGKSYMNDDEQVVRWLGNMEKADGTPRFIYIHLMSTHWLSSRMQQYRVWHRTGVVPDLGKACCAWGDYKSNYHDGILQADATVERIFQTLESKGYLDRALVAITSDHGEMLGEEGLYGHAGHPVDSLVRVPLLFYDAEMKKYPAHPLVSAVDVAPTLLDRIGAPIPAHWDGISLASPARRNFVFMQGRGTYAVVGQFDGALYKYYYHSENGTEKLVRFSSEAEELAVDASAMKEVWAGLRAEFNRQVPTVRHRRASAQGG